MKNIRLILIGLVTMGALSSGWGQTPNAQNLAIEKHYQYLEEDTKAFREAIQKENEAYRKFIQDERAEHQLFLETTIKYGSILLSLVGILLTFFGFNTFKGINQSRKELELAATGRLIAFEKEMAEYRIRFAEAQQNLRQAEADYNRFLGYYSDSNPRKGRYLIIGANEKLDSMKDDELLRFAKAFDKYETMSLEEKNFEKYQLAPFSLIVYRFQPDSEGEDKKLQELLQNMSALPEMPIVVYAKQGERIVKDTEAKLSKHGLYSIANNPITLIDNVASAYRVAKMLPKPSATL